MTTPKAIICYERMHWLLCCSILSLLSGRDLDRQRDATATEETHAVSLTRITLSPRTNSISIFLLSTFDSQSTNLS